MSHHDDLITPLDRWIAFTRRIVLRAGSASLAFLGLWLVLAISDFSISDPSWNHATGATISNLTGPAGAALADFLLQTIGGAVWLLIVPMVIWGLFGLIAGIPKQTDANVLLRAAFVPVTLITASTFLACLPTPATWPFATGLGGTLGGGIANWVSGLFMAFPMPWPRLLTGTISVIGLFWVYPTLCGLTRNRLDAAIETVEGFFSLSTRWVDTANSKIGNHRQLPNTHMEDFEDVVDPVEDEHQEDSDETRETKNDDNFTEMEVDALVKKRQIIRSERKKRESRREAAEAQHHLPMFEPGSYKLPPLNLLAKAALEHRKVISDEALEQNARMLETVLSDFGVRGEIINVRPGPVVTLYELEPAAGVKSSRVIGLADDIARSMSAVAARVAVVPGRNVIGIELPNQDREMVFLRSQLATTDYENSRADLTLALGVDIGGEPVYTDLARMPHLLIAGTTGSGKSVGINTMILSLLYRLSPDHCKLILIDPKMLELSVYDGIPHLLSPVVTDPRKAVVALKWTVREMEERYQKMSKIGVRNISGFNERVQQAEENGEALSRTVHTGYDSDTGEPIYEKEEFDFEAMPFIVVVIDEVADLMMVAGKDIEGMVQRLAQMARAAGIHLIMATQRPSVDVITGTIKANFPTRISFQVTSKIDSRTILGEQGAEQLLGQGDMLYMAGGGRLRRVHGPFVADDEVEKIVKFLKKQGKPAYVQEVTEMEEGGDGETSGLDIGGNTSSGDALYDKAVAVVLRDRKASTSYVQRRLQIGYNRAATLIERMEEDGIISPPNHAGKRDILVGEDAA